MAFGRINTISVAQRTTGSSTTFASNYTVESGSNRVVIFRVMQRGLAAAATDITFKGTSRSPTVAVDDSAGVNRTSVAIFVFKESELAAGGTSYTVTFSAAAFDVTVIAETIGDVDQSSTVRTSGSSTTVMVAGLTADVAQTVVIGDLQLAVLSYREDIPGRLVPQHSWTEDRDATSGDNVGTFGASFLIAVGTSSPFQWADNLASATDSYSMAAIALSPLADSFPLPKSPADRSSINHARM